MSDRTQDRARVAVAIEHDAALFAAILAELCPAPAGHEWLLPTAADLLCWRGDVLESTNLGVSFELAPDRPALDAPRQFNADVRWYWKHDGTFAAHPRVRHYALVRCEQPPLRGGACNLLDGPEICPSAETIPDLASRVGTALRRVIWP